MKLYDTRPPDFRFLIECAPAPEPKPDPRVVAEERLAAEFSRTVGTLDVGSLAVMQANRKRPRSLDLFHFAPLRGISPLRRSLVAMGYNVAMPEGVCGTYVHGGYRGNEGRPYVDTQCGIGLVRDDWLVAVASAGQKDERTLQLVQLQDVSSTGSDSGAPKKAHHRTGLHDGFLWRDTLVTAWEATAREIGYDTMLITAGQNNLHAAINNQAFCPGYDGVAERMGYQRQLDGDWSKEL